jgi:hypothetical protein
MRASQCGNQPHDRGFSPPNICNARMLGAHSMLHRRAGPQRRLEIRKPPRAAIGELIIRRLP